MHILLAGGGSLGHLAPCVAVARALKDAAPEAALHMVCARREEESAFLRHEGFSPTAITLPRRSWTFPVAFLKALRQAGTILDSFRPDAVFCKGGAVSVPVALAARRRKIPIVLHESDMVSGRANRMIMRWATTICTGFPHTQYAIRHTQYAGNPIRPEVTRGNKEEGRKITGLSGNKPVLLVIGGSQGARALNDIVAAHLDELLVHCDVIHLTGPGKHGAAPRAGYWQAPFAHTELPHLYALAELALSRAGANVVTELAANSIPAILVPLRGVAQDHQEANARAAEQSGGCVVVEQDDLPAALVPATAKLLGDRTLLAVMGEKMKTLYRQDAAKDIAAILVEAAMKTSA
ncbi:MAG: UDP-N-acetylglucosamine--N-acetylmuramyl-(pentapeptide) pyrophosphoryl-undecaprenol N-acetylglucosamine transferase [Candidatus Peribacteraceae bacterium]|jgi:UDP-N-acetylglucosamine--N-acetylmuramyl-(pentapeptide) pyrophosphoryl-undecaprenol N-acetylglucosamine transferase